MPKKSIAEQAPSGGHRWQDYSSASMAATLANGININLTFYFIKSTIFAFSDPLIVAPRIIQKTYSP